MLSLLIYDGARSNLIPKSKYHYIVAKTISLFTTEGLFDYYTSQPLLLKTCLLLNIILLLLFSSNSSDREVVNSTIVLLRPYITRVL